MQVVAAEGLRVDRFTLPDGTVRVNTWYAGRLTNAVEKGAQAFSVGMETPHTVLRAHFHDVAQFQVFVAGSGHLGKQPIEPMTVFYTDPFTSYGPIVAGEQGITFFTLRADHDAGVRWMPEERARRQPSPGRRVVVSLDPSEPRHREHAEIPGRVWREVAEHHEDGMRIEFVVAGPRTSLDPVFGAPQPRSYGLVLDGEVVANGTRLGRRGLLYSEDVAAAVDVATEDSGVMLALMTFPGQDVDQPVVH